MRKAAKILLPASLRKSWRRFFYLAFYNIFYAFNLINSVRVYFVRNFTKKQVQAIFQEFVTKGYALTESILNKKVCEELQIFWVFQT